LIIEALAFWIDLMFGIFGLACCMIFSSLIGEALAFLD
jgi:hypothetical protein